MADGSGWSGVSRASGSTRRTSTERRRTTSPPAGRRSTRWSTSLVRMYAPVPGASLSYLVRRLRYAAPQWHGELSAALQRARSRLSHARVDGIDWYWPADARPARAGRHETVPDTVRLLAPFDPVVWDRRRFELLWGWAYRFEAYTPIPKRKLGYYALPLLWRDRVIGWGNLSLKNGQLRLGLRLRRLAAAARSRVRKGARSRARSHARVPRPVACF